MMLLHLVLDDVRADGARHKSANGRERAAAELVAREAPCRAADEGCAQPTVLAGTARPRRATRTAGTVLLWRPAVAALLLLAVSTGRRRAIRRLLLSCWRTIALVRLQLLLLGVWVGRGIGALRTCKRESRVG